MRALRFKKEQGVLLGDLYACLMVGDPYITGSRGTLQSLANATDKIARWVLPEDAGGAMHIKSLLRDDETLVKLEDAEFAVLQECVAMVCEQGVNPTTASTRQTGRVFPAKRAMAVLEFMDAVKPYTEPDPEPEKAEPSA
jgi:hypothetical protein